MSNDEIQIIGKKVKDMYGTPVGKVVGTISDIDGSIQTVGVDCGADGLRQIQFEQLVVQTDVVIFIPKWRLDSQRLLREKGLTLRRLKALIDLVSENDDMKESAEMLHEKYKSKLSILDETENKINAQLDARTAELDEQIKSFQMFKDVFKTFQWRFRLQKHHDSNFKRKQYLISAPKVSQKYKPNFPKYQNKLPKYQFNNTRNPYLHQ